MGTTKRIVCLANSRKWQGRCIAGIEVREEGPRWVRPVSDRPQGEISFAERKFADRSEPRLLDVLDVPVIEPRPKSYQQENWLLDPKASWSRVGQLSAAELAAYSRPAGHLWLNGYHSKGGLNDRVPLAACDRIRSSLQLIRVKTMQIRVHRPGEAFADLQKRLQGRFQFGGTEYILRITDPEMEAAFLERPEGVYRLGECYLTVSLGEPFNDFCYKLIAGVIENR